MTLLTILGELCVKPAEKAQQSGLVPMGRSNIKARPQASTRTTSASSSAGKAGGGLTPS